MDEILESIGTQIPLFVYALCGPYISGCMLDAATKLLAISLHKKVAWLDLGALMLFANPVTLGFGVHFKKTKNMNLNEKFVCVIDK